MLPCRRGCVEGGDLIFCLQTPGTPTYLWNHPLLPVGRLSLNHTLGPGSDVPRAVVGVTLEDQLA